MSEKLELQYLNRATTTRLNKMLSEAGYAQWSGDSTTAEPQGCGEGYAKNCIDYVAGADPDDRRKVTNIISTITGVWG